ncbi:glutathionylspermidine synthase preATP-grasp family protein, partial [Vibrio parahaemolyticus V-223/04]
TQKKIKRRYSI